MPPALLTVYAAAFGWRALGGGLLVFDDHPGQVYRLAHAITLGLAPWRFNPGWWAGYAELQYYPPGFAWLGALIHLAVGGALDVAVVYQILLWLAWLLPGATAYLLLRRVLGDPWLALPGAVVALTLSAGCRSGVEEGLRWGLIAARLGWGMLPLLALCLLRWAEGGARAPLASAGLVAAVILLHPAHAAAAAVLVALAALHAAPRRQRLGAAALLLVGGLGLAATWLLPLLAHLRMALPLAWADATLPALGLRLASQPLLLALALLSAAAWRMARPASHAGRAVAAGSGAGHARRDRARRARRAAARRGVAARGPADGWASPRARAGRRRRIRRARRGPRAPRRCRPGRAGGLCAAGLGPG